MVAELPADERDDESVRQHFSWLTEWYVDAMTVVLINERTKSGGQVTASVAKYVRAFSNLVSECVEFPALIWS
jgi:hypothetical protein